MAIDHVERLTWAMWGLLVGDALGVPCEFHPAYALSPVERIEMIPPAGFARAHRGVAPGTWSDDGAQALALLDSVLTCGRFDAADFAGRLLAWLRGGAYAVDGLVFDVGIQTSHALERLEQGVDPTLSGPADERDNGNGSLMRVLPLSLVHDGSDEDLVAQAYAQWAVTHRHPRSQACCAFYCLWARQLLAGLFAETAWQAAVERFGEVARGSAHWDEFAEHVLPRIGGPISGSGYVVDSLVASHRLLVDHSAYADVVRHAVALGDDTDTTAAIAGGLAGLRGGIDQIPVRWQDMLRGRDILDPLLERLIAHG